MRTTILERAWRAFGPAHFVPLSRGVIVTAALLLAATNLFATATVILLSGGPESPPQNRQFRLCEWRHYHQFGI